MLRSPNTTKKARQKVMIQVFKTIKIIKIIFDYEPLYFVFSLPQLLVSSVLPLLYVYFPKLFIEKLTNKDDYIEVIKCILLYCGILLFLNLINLILSNKTSLYVDRFIKKIRQKTGEITMTLPLCDMEGARFHERLSLANHASQLTSIVSLFQNIVSSMITIVGLSIMITRVDIVFVVLVFVTLSIKIYFTWLTYRYNKKRRELYAANNRVGNYLINTAYFNPGAAKELRINHLSDWFMSKIKGFRYEMLKLQYEDFKRDTIFESISAIILAIQTIIILFELAIRYTKNMISIADFTMYFSAVTSLTTALSSIVGSIGELHQQLLNLNDFDNFKHQYNDEKLGLSSIHISNYEIEFHNVSFCYPNTDKYILNHVSIKIPYGEKLTIVGRNGAGKSTFIKLICKFYKPTTGKITIGGVDIWEIDNKEYNNLIAAVFQDFQNFAFTIDENISLNRDNNSVESVLQCVGFEHVLDNLPNKTKTYLTRHFDSNGIELSGGESQKIAIARAIYKNTPVLILDEPTASLDAKAEAEVYDNFFKLSQNKTTIFVSHRLASSTVADKIAVFSNGEIVEYGSRHELREKKGLYDEMYTAQKILYE